MSNCIGVFEPNNAWIPESPEYIASQIRLDILMIAINHNPHDAASLDVDGLLTPLDERLTRRDSQQLSHLDILGVADHPSFSRLWTEDTWVTRDLAISGMPLLK